MILQAKNLVKSYQNTPVLKGVSLAVKKGESVAICGRSGEGKTTLLHILGSLEEPDQGSVEIAGKTSPREIRSSHVGFIFQAYYLLEDFTALENVLMPARIARKPAPKAFGLELLAKVGLEKQADLPAKLLSGGERQRVAIARALCNDPDLILADEPTGNLDRENGQKIGRLLLSLNKTLILVTHDPSLASLCHHQYLLQDGFLSDR